MTVFGQNQLLTATARDDEIRRRNRHHNGALAGETGTWIVPDGG
jgi:hypothetical protein